MFLSTLINAITINLYSKETATDTNTETNTRVSRKGKVGEVDQNCLKNVSTISAPFNYVPEILEIWVQRRITFL